jgi:hypothetical protein
MTRQSGRSSCTGAASRRCARSSPVRHLMGLWHRIDSQDRAAGPPVRRGHSRGRPAGHRRVHAGGDVRALRQQVEAGGRHRWRRTRRRPWTTCRSGPKYRCRSRARPGPQARRGRRDLPAGTVLLGARARAARRGWTARPARRAPMGRPGPRGSLVRLVLRASRVLRALRARTGRMGRPARTGSACRPRHTTGYAKVCREDGAPQPSGPPGSEQGAALVALWGAARRQYV